jgi:hypothetical protein
MMLAGINSTQLLATNALERWDGARGGLFASTPWWVVAIGVVLLAGTIYATVKLYKRHARKQAWEEFDHLCEANGLRDAERRALQLVIDVAGVSYPPLLFDRDAFETSIERLHQSETYKALPDESTRAVDAQLQLVREKLSFAQRRLSEGPTTRQCEPGGHVSILVDPEKDELEGSLSGVTENRLIIELKKMAIFRDGQALVVRYSHNGIIWEFDSRVVTFMDGKLYLDHSERIRPINRRSFPRIAVNMPAGVALLPYLQDSLDTPPEFVDGRLVELAGPGFVLDAPLEVKPNYRVLVNVEMHPDKIIEATGRVLRSAPASTEGRWLFVAEMMGLSEAEIADLTRETNNAARRQPEFRTGADDLVAAGEESES